MAVFCILAHQQPHLLARLTSTLEPSRVVVHVDASVDQRPFEAALVGQWHVSLVDVHDRIDVRWAGYSMVQAMRVLLESACAFARSDEHLVMLSGQDFPIRPVGEFISRLERSGKQEIRFFNVASSSEHYKSQFERRHYRDFPRRSLGKNVDRIVRRVRELAMSGFGNNPPAELDLAFGSQWVALTRDCFLAIDDVWTPAIEEYFKRTFSPDEKILHTLIRHTAYAHANHASGADPFTGRGTYRLANYHVIDPSLSRIFTLEDFDELVKSKQFFVRKVDQHRSSDLLSRIEAEIL